MVMGRQGLSSFHCFAVTSQLGPESPFPKAWQMDITGKLRTEGWYLLGLLTVLSGEKPANGSQRLGFNHRWEDHWKKMATYLPVFFIILIILGHIYF